MPPIVHVLVAVVAEVVVGSFDFSWYLDFHSAHQIGMDYVI
jgi:hypothetical protein